MVRHMDRPRGTGTSAGCLHRLSAVLRLRAHRREVSGQIYNGRVIRDDIDDMVPCRLPLFSGRRPWRGLPDASRAHRGGGARRRRPHQRGGGGGEEGVPGARGRSGTLGGAATTAWAAADAAAAHSAGDATSRGQGGALGCLARSCTRVAGGRAAYLGLGSRDAEPPHQGLHRRP
jgi:hypothetical protein